ncbi:hypothetical protein C3B55_00064 [Candidatus Pseudomonas adelgestsugas]|uniref:Uncharacterized protein n=1 Tax=Candidatus Pseudomonas adelgestsugas TaxID=1302376 RepID=A0ABX5R7I6_9PSED|nr:hypothetical protein C3B55_00064 [Candidatus Pseudomonas adelgestsugas]
MVTLRANKDMYLTHKVIVVVKSSNIAFEYVIAKALLKLLGFLK